MNKNPNPAAPAQNKAPKPTPAPPKEYDLDVQRLGFTDGEAGASNVYRFQVSPVRKGFIYKGADQVVVVSNPTTGERSEIDCSMLNAFGGVVEIELIPGMNNQVQVIFGTANTGKNLFTNGRKNRVFLSHGRNRRFNRSFLLGTNNGRSLVCLIISLMLIGRAYLGEKWIEDPGDGSGWLMPKQQEMVKDKKKDSGSDLAERWNTRQKSSKTTTKKSNQSDGEGFGTSLGRFLLKSWNYSLSWWVVVLGGIIYFLLARIDDIVRLFSGKQKQSYEAAETKPGESGGDGGIVGHVKGEMVAGALKSLWKNRKKIGIP